jgi:antirestriction protein ArdC
MSRKTQKTTAAKANHRPTDIYQRITDLIVERLAVGVAPWRKPLMSARVNGQTHHRPVNVATGKAYDGINALVLGCSPYDIPVFGTFRQIQELGGQVKKGAKSLPVIYWQKNRPQPDADDERDRRGGFILRNYNVFNVAETSLDISVFRMGTPTPVAEPVTKKIPVCEQIIAGYRKGPGIVHRDQGRMSYSIIFDLVNMPDQVRFERPEEYYHILFHELTHYAARMIMPHRIDIRRRKASFRCGHAA